MRRGRNSDHQDRSPHRRHSGDKDNWHNANGANQHCQLTARIDGSTVPYEGRGKPSPCHAARICDQVNYKDRQADVQKIQTMLALKKIRNPKQIKPPDRISDELSEYESPGLAMNQQLEPTYSGLRRDGIAANVLQLSL